MNNNDCFEVIYRPVSSRNYIVTLAIGDKYLDLWKRSALPLWKRYCEKNDIGIIVFYDNLVDDDYLYWKKATWQKLLIGRVLQDSLIDVDNFCYLDTDILINPYAPNVFDMHEVEKISVVSLRKNLPFSINETLRREAFLRHTYYDKSYPLDSALFISIENIYKYHDLPIQDDLFCAGMFMCNVSRYSELMKIWFDKYAGDVSSITGGGDQTHLNFEFLNHGKIKWLDYRYQAIWTYEMASKYPFLYNRDLSTTQLIRECIEATLYSNYFLHFAGSWYESDMWKLGGFFEGSRKKTEMSDYYKYLETEVTGQPKGMCKPNK